MTTTWYEAASANLAAALAQLAAAQRHLAAVKRIQNRGTP